jgi:hypothetical protein
MSEPNLNGRDSLRPIAAPELARLFGGLSMLAAHRLMRDKSFPSFKIGRHRYTTEAWLAGWMTTQLGNPPLVKCFDPLEEEVIRRCAWAVGELVRQGKIKICAEENGVHELFGETPAGRGTR